MISLAHCRTANSCLFALLLLISSIGLAQDETEPETSDDESSVESDDAFDCPDELADEAQENVDPRCLELELIQRDDTADIDTESTVDTVDEKRGLTLSGDFRPLVNYLDRTTRSGEETTETEMRARVRFKGAARLSDLIGLGARIAGRCVSDDCDLEWYSGNSIPSQTGLEPGQFTFDELYVHMFQTNSFDLTVGRQQTRMVLRSGVFSRSLDRNNSNNTNINWTDGAHFALRRRRGWDGHVIVDINDPDGSSSIRRGQLDFDTDSARASYFAGTENTVPVGPIAQRSFSITYLPNALLVDGDIDGRRESYMGFVGRVAFRWPQQTDGPFFRGGFEFGYAPNVPTAEAANLASRPSNVAWNVAASLMQFRPGHNIGINFSRTGAGWLISPNFPQNEQSIELRYQWRPQLPVGIGARIRWREDIEQLTTANNKRERFDVFLRLTWQFGR